MEIPLLAFDGSVQAVTHVSEEDYRASSCVRSLACQWRLCNEDSRAAPVHRVRHGSQYPAVRRPRRS